jgi:hypothetical protein
MKSPGRSSSSTSAPMTRFTGNAKRHRPSPPRFGVTATHREEGLVRPRPPSGTWDCAGRTTGTSALDHSAPILHGAPRCSLRLAPPSTFLPNPACRFGFVAARLRASDTPFGSAPVVPSGSGATPAHAPCSTRPGGQNFCRKGGSILLSFYRIRSRRAWGARGVILRRAGGGVGAGTPRVKRMRIGFGVGYCSR